MAIDRGTIVYADDPFKEADAGRPWLVLNTPAMPFSDDQCIALTLTTKTWYDERIPLDESDVIAGGLPRSSSILPWAVASLEADSIGETLATVASHVVDEAAWKLVTYLGLDPADWQ